MSGGNEAGSLRQLAALRGQALLAALVDGEGCAAAGGNEANVRALCENVTSATPQEGQAIAAALLDIFSRLPLPASLAASSSSSPRADDTAAVATATPNVDDHDIAAALARVLPQPLLSPHVSAMDICVPVVALVCSALAEFRLLCVCRSPD